MYIRARASIEQREAPIRNERATHIRIQIFKRTKSAHTHTHTRTHTTHTHTHTHTHPHAHTHTHTRTHAHKVNFMLLSRKSHRWHWRIGKDVWTKTTFGREIVVNTIIFVQLGTNLELHDKKIWWLHNEKRDHDYNAICLSSARVRGKEKINSLLYLIIMWTLLYKGLMLKCTQDKLLKMFIIAVVIINYTHE